ncbi:MAG: zinc ribbon domain-containing protein [Myxococcota bacterium]|jgi:cell division protein FtsN|nr:zinc ribbon domain-containing protein [Myxococcota bacterium]
MTIALIILFVCFTLVMAWQTLSPFIGGSQEQLRFDLLEDELRQVEELTTRKNLYLDNLREIEIDRDLDKLSEKDFLELKRRYERETVKLMRQLDEVHGGRGWEARVEDAIEARLSLDGKKTEALEDKTAKTPKKTKKKKKKSSTGKKQATTTRATESAPAEITGSIQCPECDKEMEAAAKFCSQCGADIAHVTPELPEAQISAAE